MDKHSSNSLLSRFLGGTISVGIGNIFSLVLNLLGTMIAARQLSEVAFGAFILLQVVATFLMQMSSFGLNTSIAKFITSIEDEGQKRILINSAFCFRILTIITLSLFVLLFRKALITLFDSSIPLNIAIFIPILFMLESLNRLLISILQGFFLFKRIGMIYFIDSLCNLLWIVVLVWQLDRGILGLIFAKLVSLSLSCTFAFSSIPIRKKFEFNFNSLKEVLSFGFPLQLNDMLTFVFQRIDTLIIGALLGPTEIAYYEIARKIPDSLGRLFEAFRSVLFPFTSKLHALGEKGKLAFLINNSLRMITFLCVFSSLFIFLFGNEVVIFLFSDKYLPSVPTFSLLMVIMSISFASNIMGTSLVAVGKSNKPIIINTFHSVVSLLGNLLLLPRFGILGAGLANLAGNLISNPLNVLFLFRAKVKFSIGSYLKPLFALGLCIILIFILNPMSILNKTSIIVLFTTICALLSVVTLRDLSTIWREAKPILPWSSRHSHSKDIGI